MVLLLEKLFSVSWHEVVPRQWREGLIVRRVHDREQPGNYRGTMLLNVVGMNTRILLAPPSKMASKALYSLILVTIPNCTTILNTRSTNRQ